MSWNYMNGSPPPRRPSSGKDNDGIWWVFIVLAFVTGIWPVGVILLILRVTLNKKNEAQKMATRWEQNAPSYVPPAATQKDAAFENRNTASGANSPSNDTAPKFKKSKLPLILTVLSVLFAVAGVSGFAETLDLILWVGGVESYMFGDLFAFIGFLVGAGVLFFSGRSLRKKEKRYSKYITFVGEERRISIEALAAAMPVSVDLACKDLQNMIDKGYFGKNAYIDISRMELVLFADENPFAAKESSPEKRDGASIEIPDLEDAERSEIIEKIRELDEAILDEEVSAKIRRIQDLTDRILAVVEANPHKKPQIRTFMNYYLPTTLKLLKSYSEFEAQGIAGDTIAQTKASISAILDNLVKGYEQQLDQLFQSEAMDISSDIQVLESMMRRDGLAGEYPFRTEKAADPPKDQTLTLN